MGQNFKVYCVLTFTLCFSHLKVLKSGESNKVYSNYLILSVNEQTSNKENFNEDQGGSFWYRRMEIVRCWLKILMVYFLSQVQWHLFWVKHIKTRVFVEINDRTSKDFRDLASKFILEPYSKQLFFLGFNCLHFFISLLKFTAWK